MSRIKTHNNANCIIERFARLNGLKNDADIAKLLGVKPSTVSSWRVRDSVNYNLIIAHCKPEHQQYILTGQGEPFVSSSTETTPPKDVPQYILDLLRKTERILKSESMYCNLLAGAIMSYDKSLTDEEEKLAEKRRLNALESQFKECVAQLNDLLEKEKSVDTGE
ncbi:MAG: helix-turn-helix domain-containing protein [Candidatus Omnitrophica bacterium]|nr:helix-turn-helix domain-containing protein [Candidatus Omnitrophota bacterium]